MQKQFGMKQSDVVCTNKTSDRKPSSHITTRSSSEGKAILCPVITCRLTLGTLLGFQQSQKPALHLSTVQTYCLRFTSQYLSICSKIRIPSLLRTRFLNIIEQPEAVTETQNYCLCFTSVTYACLPAQTYSTAPCASHGLQELSSQQQSSAPLWPWGTEVHWVPWSP